MRDVLIHCEDIPWVDIGGGASVKYLRNCESTGQWTQLLWLKSGATLPPHYHLGAGEFIVLKGELHYASGIAKQGDYGYEAIGAIHEKTSAPVDTVLFYLGHGPLALTKPDGSIMGVVDGFPQESTASARLTAAVKDRR